MTLATHYSVVQPTDPDVALFIAMHPQGAALVRLGIKKAWVARQDDEIVGVMTLRTTPFPALNYLAADPSARTFMRLHTLWRMAELWLLTNNVPAICVEVHELHKHFQSLLRRLGFVATPGSDDLGLVVYLKRMKEGSNADSLDETGRRDSGAAAGDAVLEGHR